ncbi:MAG: nucleoside deaminase [Bacteroidia bacterium]|nr:nucleoside deaminase [Bacteroidia bacterium]
MEQHETFMREAIRLSVENVGSGVGGPFGAVVVKDGQIIARGQNRVTSTQDPTAHAEVVAIREACQTLGHFQLDGCDLYTSCEPCPMCLGAIYWARPDRVFYANTCADAAAIGFDDRFIYDEITLAHAERRIPMIPLLRDEAGEAFRRWHDDGDKTLY